MRLIPRGREIRRTRILNGWSQRTLAAASDVAAPVLCKVERGTRGTTPEVLARIADALGVDLLEVAEFVDDEPVGAHETAPAPASTGGRHLPTYRNPITEVRP